MQRPPRGRRRGRRTDFLAQASSIEAEDPRGRVDVALRAQRHHRQEEHRLSLGHLEHRIHIHARTQQPLLVPDVDQDCEHRDVLVDDGLRLDLLDDAPELPPRIRGHANTGRHAGGELADVRFVHAHARAHAREISHRQQRRATADVLGRRRDHLPALDETRQDCARGRRAHFSVLERDARVLELDAGSHGLCVRVRDLQFERLELRLVDPGIGAQLFAALELGLCRRLALRRSIDLGLRLIDAVLRRARVNADEKPPGLDAVADFRSHFQDLA